MALGPGVSSIKETPSVQNETINSRMPSPTRVVQSPFTTYALPFPKRCYPNRRSSYSAWPEMTTIGFEDPLQTLSLLQCSTISTVYHFRTHKVHAMLEVSWYRHGPPRFLSSPLPQNQRHHHLDCVALRLSCPC